MFVSASEDKTRTLDVIEEKIARATMIPRSHGEVTSLLRFLFAERHFGGLYQPDLLKIFLSCFIVLLIDCLDFYLC